MQDALIFLVQLISAFLENNPNEFLFINKVQSLSFPIIYPYPFCIRKEIEKIAILKKDTQTLLSTLKPREVFYTVCLLYRTMYRVLCKEAFDRLFR